MKYEGFIASLIFEVGEYSLLIGGLQHACFNPLTKH